MKSLKTRLSLAFLLLIIIIYAMFFIGTKFLLEDFYYQKNISAMLDVEKNLNNLIKINEDTEAISEAIKYLNYNFEGNISVFHSSGKTALTSTDIELLTKAIKIEAREIEGAEVFFILTDYPVKNSHWLVYSSLLENGDILIATSPISAITNSVKLIEKFINIIILLSALVAIVISLFLSKNLSKPINELRDMAIHLRDLDFNKVYKIDRKDEIGELSATFTELAGRLDYTISSLNSELSKDKEINKIRQDFIATASHELKTPITIIKSYVEALEDGIVDSKEERMDYYHIIDEETEKITSMLDKLLQITLIESEEFSINKKDFNLTVMLEKLAKDYEIICQKKGLDFTYNIAKTSSVFSGDELRLEQAFRNVLNNALKFSDNTEAIRLNSEVSNNTLVINIENNGEKISPEDLGQVFELFYKSGSKGGSGIGLAVTSNILNKHGISYFIHNTPKGVKFTAKIKIQ